MTNHDVVAARIGRDQLGLVLRSQLRTAGIDHRVVARRLASKIWTEPHPYVIDLGTHPPSWDREVLALALASGDGACASHRTAAHLHGMLDVPRPLRVDVTVERGRPHQVDGLELHTTVRLDPDERDTVRGIPVTSRLRTVLDLACDLDREHLELLVADEVRGRPEAARHLARIAQRRRGWPGTPKVLAILEAIDDGNGVDSFMEVLGQKRFRDDGRIPLPAVQAVIRHRPTRFRARVDALWDWAMLIGEFQGRRYHDAPTRRDRDADRRDRLEALGYRVIEIRWEDLHGDRLEALMDEIADHLARYPRPDRDASDTSDRDASDAPDAR